MRARVGKFGGNLKDLPKPHIWFFDDKRRKRPVKVTMTRYVGIGIHYHVSIVEDEDCVWDTRTDDLFDKPVWARPWDFPADRRGRTFHDKFGDPNNARVWAHSILDKHFPLSRYQVRWEDTEDEKWFYRDGD